MLSIVSQLCSNVFLNTFYAKQKDYSLELASIITRDINKLLKASPNQKLNLDIIKNYKIESVTAHDNKAYLSPDILKLVRGKDVILIDLHYIKRLVTLLYNNHIKVEFVDTKLHPPFVDSRKALHQRRIADGINFVSYSNNIHDELALKARLISYISSLIIVVVLTSFYMMIRKLYLRKEAAYKQCQKNLVTREKFRAEYKKLTKLLYKPIVSKLKAEIYHDIDQEFGACVIFSVLAPGDSNINIKTFSAALSDFFYFIKFKFHTKIDDSPVRIGINNDSFCQIIYSFVNHIHNSLGDNPTIDFHSEISDSNLIITMEYVTSEFASVHTLNGKEELLHPFLINASDIFKILAQNGIYSQKTNDGSQSTIKIKLQLQGLIKASENNLCHLKDYR